MMILSTINCPFSVYKQFSPDTKAKSPKLASLRLLEVNMIDLPGKIGEPA